MGRLGNATAEYTSATAGSNSEVGALDSILITCIGVEGTLMIIGLWVFSCMIVYGTKTNKWKKKEGEPFLNGRTIYLACLFAVTLTIPRFAWSIVTIQLPRFKGSDALCEILMDITGVTYSVAMCPAYLFLWLRQRALYADPTIRNLNGKCANVISWSLIICLSIGSLVMLIIIQVPDSYSAAPQGCLFKQDVGYNTNFYVLAGLLGFSQFSLLCLFIYPMIKTRQSVKDVSRAKDEEKESSCFPSCLHNLGGEIRGRSVVEKTIYRSVASTITAVISDVTTMAVANFVLPSTLPISIAVTLYDVSIMINVFCILATFGNYRKILTVFCNWRRNEANCESDTVG